MVFVIKNNKHHFFSEIDDVKFPYAVSQSFMSVFLHLSLRTMATGQKCCHLPGKMLNFTAKAADRAQIQL
jgi:hypothetical protein